MRLDDMRMKTSEQYVKELKEKNPEIICLEDYKGVHEKILHRHTICNYEWKVIPRNILRGDMCPKCSGRLPRTHEDFEKILSEKQCDNFKLINPYVKYNQKIKVQHKCGYIFETYPSTLLVAEKGKGCPKCSKRHFYKKSGNLADNYIEFCKYLANEDDAYKYGRYTEEKLLFKCPDCGHTQYRKPNSVITHGFHCEVCRDGISKNEKIMRSLLSQLGVDFEVEKSFEWCGKKRYDFYFDNIICEMHGNQHYAPGFLIEGNQRSFEEEINNDIFKKTMAYNNGFNDGSYIIIDCREQNFQWVKDHILSSKLSDYYDLSIIDWNKCELDSVSSIAILANNLWNGRKSISDIVKELKISNSTATKYLTQLHNIGLNSYDYEEERRKSASKKVVCLNTKEIFDSLTNASKLYNVDGTSISACCMRERNSAGTYNGQKLVWAYYNDYLRYSNNDIQELIENDHKNNRKVICLNTKQVFTNVTSATKHYGFKSKSSISACCKGKTKTAGKDTNTGEKLKWMYYEDYLESTICQKDSA